MSVVPHDNNDESENLALRVFSQDLFSGCILLTPLSVAPQGQMCGESGRGEEAETQARLSVPSEFTSSRENPV